MSQQSEERLEPAAADQPPSPPTARILQFEPRQSDLQRAIQQRAQEAIEREADRERQERKPKPLKWLTIAIIASLPAVLMFSAVDNFLRVFHRYMETSFASQPQDPQSAGPANIEPEAPAAPSEPGVVMLSPVTPAAQQPPQQQPPQSAPDSQQKQ